MVQHLVSLGVAHSAQYYKTPIIFDADVAKNPEDHFEKIEQGNSE
jgi:hypothetical protein